MIRGRIEAAAGWLKRVFTEPRSELGRWQRAVRYGYDLGWYGARQLAHDRAPQMSAALAFRALFGLVPVLIVAMVLVKGVAGVEEFLRITREVSVALGLDQVRIIPPSGVAPEAPAQGVTLAEWLEGLVQQAAGVNLAAVGWVGLAVLIYAAIGMVVTVEDCFNTVYHAPQGRPWPRRISVYWFLLTVSPLILGLTLYLDNRVEAWIAAATGAQWLLALAGTIWRLLLVWLFLLAAYVLVPNTAVAVRPAMIGAGVTAVLLEIGRRSLGAYLENAFTISQLFGSLGLIPLFMFWMYLMWLAVLFGLEVSATLQTLGGRRLEEIPPQEPPSGLLDPAVVVTVMGSVAEEFSAGRAATVQGVADATALPPTTVATLFQRLIAAGFLHRLEREDNAVALARPAEKIPTDELMEVGFRLADEGRAGAPRAFVERLREAQRRVTAGASLAAAVCGRVGGGGGQSPAPTA